MAAEFATSFCESNSFVACTELDPQQCRSLFTEAENQCDYSVVWSEIKNQDHIAAQELAKQYGDCIISNVEKNLEISVTKWHKCFLEKIDEEIQTGVTSD